MAVAADYSGWVRELDEYQAGDGQYDERLEATHESGKAALQTSSSRGVVTTTSRKMKPGSTTTVSQAEELQQEMKLLSWHKLANEAALKAAIIKTNKMKQEDTQFANALTEDEREERAQRAQQIIEEEQLKPLQVNTDFFHNLKVKSQRDEDKLDGDVQRHIQHLRKLKESLSQREDMQRRRQRYREKMLELQGDRNAISRPKSLAVDQQRSNQNEEAKALDKRDRANNTSVYHRAAMAAGGKAAQDNANVLSSLDKLMELEQRIRHLEDAGLAVDDLDDVMNGSASSSKTAGTKQAVGTGNLRLAKRRATGGLHEPSRTVYAVRGTSKMCARDVLSSRRAQVPTAANAKKRAFSNSNQTGARSRAKSKADTFLTSLPENKQRQLRRMTERERRNYMKTENAKEARNQARKQDVIIEDWLEKKRAAANQRKASTSHVRAGAAAAKSTLGASGRNPRQRLPPPPRVRAPTIGAASGKRMANSHSQKIDEIKKGFAKRKEAFQRLPPTTHGRSSSRFNTSSTASTRNQRSFTRSAVIGANVRSNSASQRFGGTTLPSARTMAPTRAVASRQVSGRLRGGQVLGPVAGHAISKLPQIQRIPVTEATRHPGPSLVIRNNATLPRLATRRRSSSMPSPPSAVRNTNMPTFSRLHKR